MYFETGTLFRHYRIVEMVGEGGMGVVYRAADTHLGRDVALKFLRPQLSDPRLAPDLHREARALAALNHPGIVTIYEIGAVDGAPFLALEWIGGGTLRERPPRPAPIADFAAIALQIADALAAAHDQGIVHRDVKPGNVLLTVDGRVKLADFGLAKSVDAELDATRTAGLLGTVSYMSPEQANGGPVGPTSDVFSFGVLAYELLTGRMPFTGTGPAAILGAIVTGAHVPVAVARPEVPAHLADIIERCLQKAPADRFRSARELADALRAEPSTVPRRRSSAEGVPPVRAAAEPDQEVRFTTTEDGCSIAYARAGAGPVLVRVLGHFTHVELEWQWADLRAFWQSLADHFTVVRYDGRGMGLSAPFEGTFTEETRQHDLAAVLDAIGEARVALLGISEGGWTAATYAVQHPQRVSQLILYGAYCRGARVRPGYDTEEDQALVTLIRKGWGRDTPAFRQVFTSQFFGPDAAPSVIGHFNELQRVSATPETAARYYQALHERGDGSDIFRRLRVPTLVMHSRHDLAVSADEGRLLASIIPGAQLALQPSGTHYFPTDAESVAKAAGTIVRFLRATSPSTD